MLKAEAIGFLIYIWADFVIGRNVDFDKNMLKAEAKRYHINFPFDQVKWLDTMKSTTWLIPGSKKHCTYDKDRECGNRLRDVMFTGFSTFDIE